MEEALRQLLDSAKRHYLRADYSRARPLLEKFLQQEQGFADVHNMLGVVYHAAGHLGRAQSALERALSINPRYTEAALNLAVLYNDMGRYDEARQVYSRALGACAAHPSGLDPFIAGKIANMHADIADAYRNAQKPREALAEYQRALDLCPTYADIRTQMASLMLQEGMLQEAAQALTRALEDRPLYHPARVQLGVCRQAQRDMKGAIEAWTTVLGHDPEHRTAAMYLRLAERQSAEEGAKAP